MGLDSFIRSENHAGMVSKSPNAILKDQRKAKPFARKVSQAPCGRVFGLVSSVKGFGESKMNRTECIFFLIKSNRKHISAVSKYFSSSQVALEARFQDLLKHLLKIWLLDSLYSV